MIPQDPHMLLSFINMKLRNDYASLGELCCDLNIDQDELTETLSKAGFEYTEELNKFW